jgi:hypothetical protein
MEGIMAAQPRSIGELASLVQTDPQLEAQIKANPAAALAGLATPIPDTTVYRMVVGGVILAILGAIVGVLIYMVTDATSEGVLTTLTAIASAALGGLVGLLAPQPNQT